MVGEHDGMSSGLKLHGQVGGLRVGVDAHTAERIEEIVIALGNSPEVETEIFSEVALQS